MSSSHCDGSSCSSESKHDRRKAPRLQLFLRGENSWVRVLVKIVFVAQKLSTIRSGAKKKLVSLGDKNKDCNPESVSESSSL
jgi:hypothetical protein